MAQHQIQRYEAIAYRSTSLARLCDIANALGVTVAPARRTETLRRLTSGAAEYVPSMYQHNGKQRYVEGNSGQHEMCSEQVKGPLPGMQQSFGCGLITRRLQVQILPPPPKRPGQKPFLARSCLVRATTLRPVATQPQPNRGPIPRPRAS